MAYTWPLAVFYVMSRIGYALCSYNSVQSEGWFVEDGEGDFNSDAHDEIRELMDEKISFQWRKKKKNVPTYIAELLIV